MNPFLGQIELFPYPFTPKDWLPCEGQVLQIQMYTALFTLLGTSFGGDGETTFALPDLRGKAPAPNLQYFIAMNGVYPERSE